MASVLPGKQYLDTLRALRGAPKITYPYGDTAYPRIERVYSVPKGRVDDIPTSLADFAGSVRTQLAELERDATDVEVFVRYDTLPGPILSGRLMSPDAQGAIVTTTTQRLAAGAADLAPTWKTLLWSDTPLDTLTKERNVTTLGDAANVAEISRVITTGVSIPSLSGKFFTLEDQSGPVAPWFDVDNLSANPAPAGHRLIEINLTSTGNQTTTVDTSAGVAATLGGQFFTLQDVTGAVAVWFNYNGTSTDPAPADHRMIEVPLVVGAAEVSTIDFTGATPAALDGAYVTLADADGDAFIWWNVDSLSSIPGPAGRAIQVDILTGDTDEDIATKTQLALDADAAFGAIVDTALVTITDAALGTRTDIGAGDSGLAVAVTTQGVNDTTDIAASTSAAVYADAAFTASYVGDVVTIAAVATGPLSASTAGTSGLTVSSALVGEASAATQAASIAAAIAAALDADAQFAASVTATNTVTITDAAYGQRGDINAHDTGLAVAVLVAGGALESFPVLTDYDQDPQNLALITTTFEVVNAATVTAPTRVVGRITHYKPIDKWRSLKIVQIFSTPASYSEQRFGAQNFYKLFTSFVSHESCGVIMKFRDSFSAMVASRLDVSYGPKQTIQGLTIIPNGFRITTFNISGILNDRLEFDSDVAGCDFETILPASSPSLSAYNAMRNSYQLLTGESVLDKAGYYKTSKLYVRLI
jgi:hypothetical protein